LYKVFKQFTSKLVHLQFLVVLTVIVISECGFF
jgi:hypothetical protein